MEVNRIIHADALEELKKLPDNCIDLTVTSPPYDNLREFNGHHKFDFYGIAQELYRVTKEGGVVVWVVGDATVNGSETGTSFRQAIYFKDECGFNLHDTMIYQKNNFAHPSDVRYHQVFEYMFVFSKGQPKTINLIKDRRNIYIGQKAHGFNRGKDRWNKNRVGETKELYGKRHNVWIYTTGGGHVTKDSIAYEHPAIFPEQLAEDHIKSWSKEGDLVLDPFLGSGTTAKTALKLNRNFIGIEINKEYVELAEKRIKPWLEQDRLENWF